jgi:hypothetical protein
METISASPADRHPLRQRKHPQRTRVSNGSELLPGVDGRLLWARRAKELLSDFLLGQFGGASNVSEAEHALLRRAVTLIVELERREVGFAQAGAVDDEALAIYQTAVNTLRRTLEALGLQRRPRDVSEDDETLAIYNRVLREGDEAEAE